MSSLLLVPIHVSEQPDMLEPLAKRLQDTFRLSVTVERPWFDPEPFFDPSRGQYHSTQLLKELLRNPHDPTSKLLGVTSVDLFIPVLTFVFGEAQLDGRAAVVSFHRLRNEAYGLAKDDALLLERLIKEAVHEIGHTCGLRHCGNAECVMRASTYVEEIDLKGSSFCAACLRHVHAPI